MHSATRRLASPLLSGLRKSGWAGGVPASWTLTCLWSPENSFSAEVSRNVVVLDP